MGRLAEAEGEAAVWRDLRMKIFIDPDAMKTQYEASPAWLKALMNAWADGLNFYLVKHPQVKPRVIQHFEPWMALTFTEGSIGGDIETINLNQLQAFYGKTPVGTDAVRRSVTGASPLNHPQYAGATGLDLRAEPSGSNGFAIAPANTTSRHALLLIN